MLLILAVVIVAGVVFWGINARIQTAAAVKETTRELAIPAVSVVHPKPGAMKNEVVLPGNIQAFTDSPIYARSSGYLKQWSVDIGGKVKAGQVLAIIEAPELDQQVRQAKATIQQTQASLDQAIANQQQGKANEEIARVTAQRWQNLVNKGAVSRQENDQYQAQYQAQVANLNALQQAIAAARSNIAVAEANLARLQEMQNYETVKAPFDGIITARNIDVGALINAGNGGAAQELFHMAIHCEAARLRQRTAGRFARRCSRAQVVFDAGGISRTQISRRTGPHLGRHRSGHANIADGSGCRQCIRRTSSRRLRRSPSHDSRRFAVAHFAGERFDVP